MDRLKSRFGATRRAFAAGCAATFSIGAKRAHAAQFQLKAATSVPSSHPLNTRQLQMWAAVERESGGRVHTQLFPNSQLGNDASMLTQLRVGALAFYLQNAGIFAAVSPIADVTNLGFAFRDEAEGCRVADGPLGAYVREETEAKGFHLLRSAWNGGMNVIGSSSRPIRSPDDLPGFKLRLPTIPIYVDLFKELGASPVPITGGEVYAALQTHLVDGEAAAIASLDTYKWYEVNKYVSLVNFGWSGNWMVSNAEIWKSIPADLQEIIERNNTKYAAIESNESIANNAAIADKFERAGLTVIRQVDPEPFRARLKPYYANWAKKFGPKAWALLEASIGHKLA